MDLDADVGEARRFLRVLDPRPQAAFHFQTFDDDKSREDLTLARVIPAVAPDLTLPLNRMASLNRRGAGAFVTISELSGERRLASAYVRARAIFVDLDGVPDDAARALRPSMIVTSRAGAHAYWLLDLGEETCPADELRGLLRAAAERCGADPRAATAERVLRLPGYYHRKTADPFMVRVTLAGDERITLSAARRMFPPAGTRPAASRSSEDRGKITPQELARALDGLRAEDFSDRADWFELMCACHHATGGAGREEFLEWSATDRRYASARRDNGQQWDSVTPRSHVANPITAGTLAKRLRDAKRHDLADMVVYAPDSRGLLADAGSPPSFVTDNIEADVNRGLRNADSVVRSSWGDRVMVVQGARARPKPKVISSWA